MTVFRDRSKTAGLAQSFQNAYGQISTPAPEEKRKPRKSHTVSDSRRSFDRKLRELRGETFYNSLTCADLLCYFQKASRDAGNEYVVPNFAQEAGMLKNLMTKLPNIEICAMIDFLFQSGQTYIIDPSPRVLVSKWLNTIRRDTRLWALDKYDPHAPVKKSVVAREWEKKSEDEVKIGEWD